MATRDLALNNFRWKLTALLLAMLVWFVIKFAIYRGMAGGPSQVFRHQTVMVLKSPEDTRVFRVDPPYVDVVVQASRPIVGEDLQVYVDLTSMLNVSSAVKQVVVRTVESAKLRAEPPYVVVEQVGPSDAPLGGSLRK